MKLQSIHLVALASLGLAACTYQTAMQHETSRAQQAQNQLGAEYERTDRLEQSAASLRSQHRAKKAELTRVSNELMQLTQLTPVSHRSASPAIQQKQAQLAQLRKEVSQLENALVEQALY